MKRTVFPTALVCCTLFVIGTGTASPAADLEKEVIGPWQLKFTTPKGKQETPLVVVGWQHGQYLAWHVDGDQVQSFNDVRLQENALVGTIEPGEEPGVTLSVKATLAGQNKCTVLMNYRSDQEAGILTFTGHRITLLSLDEVQTWKLNFVAPDYKKYAPTVTVVSEGDNPYAWISGELVDRSREPSLSGSNVLCNTAAPNTAVVRDPFYLGKCDRGDMLHHRGAIGRVSVFQLPSEYARVAPVGRGRCRTSLGAEAIAEPLPATWDVAFGICRSVVQRSNAVLPKFSAAGHYSRWISSLYDCRLLLSVFDFRRQTKGFLSVENLLPGLTQCEMSWRGCVV